MCSLNRFKLFLVAVLLSTFLFTSTVANATPNDESLGLLVGQSSSISVYPESSLPEDTFTVRATSYLKKVNKSLSNEQAASLVRYVSDAAEEQAVDKRLILAIIRTESRFNSVARSKEGAAGLMQIIPKYHRDKITKASSRFKGGIYHPGVNISVGVQVFKEYSESTKTLVAALLRYNGSSKDKSAVFAKRVLAAYRVIVSET